MYLDLVEPYCCPIEKTHKKNTHFFPLWALLCLQSSRSKYNTWTINYFFFFCLLHFDLKQTNKTTTYKWHHLRTFIFQCSNHNKVFVFLTKNCGNQDPSPAQQHPLQSSTHLQKPGRQHGERRGYRHGAPTDSPAPSHFQSPVHQRSASSSWMSLSHHCVSTCKTATSASTLEPIDILPTV